jgi:low temperature requirement protein LtrA
VAQVTGDLAGNRHFRQGRVLREQRTTTVELFFDLVFVFAVTQLSHALLGHLTWAGAARTLFLLLLVWWAWNYTTWMTDFVDPESPPIRLMLIAVMLASLLMAIAIPEAFGDRAVLFAVAYVAIQLIRNATVTAVAPRGSASRATVVGILADSVAAGALLILGAFCRTTCGSWSGCSPCSSTFPAPRCATASRGG